MQYGKDNVVFVSTEIVSDMEEKVGVYRRLVKDWEDDMCS